MTKRASIIVNPIAGGRKNADDLIRRLSASFSRNSFHIEMKITTRSGDANQFAAEAVREEKDLVVVVGGDGTINEVASGLVHSEVAMGIVPRGSGNGLARSLDIPTSIDAACDLIKQGHVSPIDVGRVNERYFFLVVGVGFDAAVGKRFDGYHKRGPLAYFYLGVKEYMNYAPKEIEVDFGEQTLTLTPFLVAVANGQQYGNNAVIAPHARLNDGLLDLCIVHSLSPLELFSAVPKMFRGKLDKYRQAEFHQAEKVTIRRQSDDYVNLDGEAVFERSVLEVSILRNALRVITPRDVASLISD